MTYTAQDKTLAALCVWRENRHGLRPGMQSVMNVVFNRVHQRRLSPYDVVTQRWQFSSITARNDAQLSIWPMDGDPNWMLALELFDHAAAGTLEDITGDATNYYAPAGVTETPAWVSGMTYTVTVAGHRFYR